MHYSVPVHYFCFLQEVGRKYQKNLVLIHEVLQMSLVLVLYVNLRNLRLMDDFLLKAVFVYDQFSR